MRDEDIWKGKAGTVRNLDETGQTGARFGRESEGYGDLFIFVPEMMQVVRISEGTGGNLLWEDVEEEYVDYIYYEQHSLDIDMPVVDGGQVLLKGIFRDLFRCTADCIPAVLDMAYGDDTTGYVILVSE